MFEVGFQILNVFLCIKVIEKGTTMAENNNVLDMSEFK
jgi:hypothetical protein